MGLCLLEARGFSWCFLGFIGFRAVVRQTGAFCQGCYGLGLIIIPTRSETFNWLGR